MEKIRILLSLSTDANNFQRAQQVAAQRAADQLNVDLKIVHADNDPITQSHELLLVIQGHGAKPHAILVQPAGSNDLHLVAQAAVTSGVGWVILNREPSYIAQLRRISKIPIFAVGSNQTEIGRIQGRHLAALLPKGGKCLYLHGPSGTSVAQLRATGMNDIKPENISTLVLKCANWTQEAGYKAVSTWLRLWTANPDHIDLIAGQNDAFVFGARQAIEEEVSPQRKAAWQGLPFIGADGLPEEGQAKVNEGLLAATIIIPPNAGMALELTVNAIRGGPQPPESSLTIPVSYPAIQALRSRPKRPQLIG